MRKQLWAGFIDSSTSLVDSEDAHGRVGISDKASVRSTIADIKKTLASIEGYLVER